MWTISAYNIMKIIIEILGPNVFWAGLGAQLTICAHKWRNFVWFSMLSLRFVWSRVCVFFIFLAPGLFAEIWRNTGYVITELCSENSNQPHHWTAVDLPVVVRMRLHAAYNFACFVMSVCFWYFSRSSRLFIAWLASCFVFSWFSCHVVSEWWHARPISVVFKSVDMLCPGPLHFLTLLIRPRPRPISTTCVL